MDYRFNIKKLGSHWYLDINHDNPIDLCFDEKIEKTLSKLDKNNSGLLVLLLSESYSIVYPNTIFINDEDILRYFTTDDYFDIRFCVGDHEYCITSALYNLLESYYNINFHKTVYTIDIFNWMF